MKTFSKLGMRSLAAAALVVAATPAAFADKKSEAYVQANANIVLQVLNDKSLNDTQREAKFGEYMNKFAHMPTIARRVLGVNGRSISQPDFDKYYKIFEHYALEVYQVHFDQFRGETLRVVGSKDEDERRSTVESMIKSSKTGKDTKVYWDVLRSQDGADLSRARCRHRPWRLDALAGPGTAGPVRELPQPQQRQYRQADRPD